MRVSSWATWTIAASLIAACVATGTAPPGPTANAPKPRSSSCLVAPVSVCPTPAPAFAIDVQPILRKRCFVCHTDGGPAAEEHDFANSKTLHAQRSQIADQIVACAMPPRSLIPAADARTLLAWVACGAQTD